MKERTSSLSATKRKRSGRSGSKSVGTMPQKPEGHKIPYRRIWPAAVTAFLTVALYETVSGIDLWVSIGFLIVIALASDRSLRMRAVDWSVVSILSFEVLSLGFSQYRANSIPTARTVAIAVVVYFAIRLVIATSLQVGIYSAIVALGGSWLSFSGLRGFAQHADLFRNAGLTNLVAFRSRLIPVPSPWVLGEWLTLLLLALPFACAIPLLLWRSKRKWLIVAALVPAVVIGALLVSSMSRAIFWSTILFFVVSCGLMITWSVIGLRTGLSLLAFVLGTFLIALTVETFFFPGVGKAYFGRTTSQVRSTEGRVAIWKRSLEIAKSHPVLGIGSSNAALALTSTADDEDTTGFASRTFSLPLQLLVEKGILGCLLYATFLALLGREFVEAMDTPSLAGDASNPHGEVRSSSKSSRQVIACCFAGGIIAVLARELAYSSLLEHTVTLALFFALAALASSSEVFFTR